MNIESAQDHDAAPPGITLRPEQPGDESLLFQWYASTREDELSLAGWNEAARTTFLSLQFKAMRQGYAQMFPQAQFSIILAAGTPAGRLVVNRAADEIHVIDIIVAREQRGRGIGSEVLGALINEAGAAGKPLRLQALKNSRAITLYRRLGFCTTRTTEIYELMECKATPMPPGG